MPLSVQPNVKYKNVAADNLRLWQFYNQADSITIVN